MGKRQLLDERGFTLLELIVTLAIVAMAIALAMPTIGRSTETIRARAEVARFTAMLRHAREQAITTRRTHAFVVDVAGHKVNLMAGEDVRETRALASDFSVRADPPAAVTVRFEPYGGSSGGLFHVLSGAVRYRVSVDAVTSRVRVDRE